MTCKGTGIFDPVLWTVDPLTFSNGTTLPPPPFVYLSWKVKYGRIARPERVVFDRRPPFVRASAKFMRHAAKKFV